MSAFSTRFTHLRDNRRAFAPLEHRPVGAAVVATGLAGFSIVGTGPATTVTSVQATPGQV